MTLMVTAAVSIAPPPDAAVAKNTVQSVFGTRSRPGVSSSTTEDTRNGRVRSCSCRIDHGIKNRNAEFRVSAGQSTPRYRKGKQSRFLSLGNVTTIVFVFLVLGGLRIVESWLQNHGRNSLLPLSPTKTIAERNFGVGRGRCGSPGDFRSVVLPASKETTGFDSNTVVEYQSDANYDRGDMHLSAALHEGETVVYRTGSWYVDGVLVGDETDLPPTYEMCRIETIQVVWTHNCEHGVLRGLAVDHEEEDSNGGGDDGDRRNDGPHRARLVLRAPLEDVEFGPEQIIARIRNVVWESAIDGEDGEEIGTCSIPLDPSLWREHDANA